MRHIFLLFLMLLIHVPDAHAMELKRLAQTWDEAYFEEPSYNLHESISTLTHQFYGIQTKLAITISCLKYLDPQKKTNIDYDKISEWLEKAKRHIDRIGSFRMSIFSKEEQLQEPKMSATHRKIDAVRLRHHALLKSTLLKLHKSCSKSVESMSKYEKQFCELPKIASWHRLCNKLVRQTYFKTLSWITQDGAGKSDIVVFLIGARGCEHQEFPAFLKKIARENPHLQIVIYSIGCDITNLPIAEAHFKSAGITQPCFSINQKVDVKTIADLSLSDDLNTLISTEKRKLSQEQEQTFTQLPIIYTSDQFPNVKLVSCFLQLPLLGSQTGYLFFEYAFSDYIKRKLNEGAILFMGNHTQCYNLQGIPLIAQLYYKLKHEDKNPRANNLQLYTQGDNKQCVVYDPIESADQPIKKFYDHARKLFWPEKKIYLTCSVVPYAQFISENGLQYHIKQGQQGIVITHVSSNEWQQPEILTKNGEISSDPGHPEAPQPC